MLNIMLDLLYLIESTLKEYHNIRINVECRGIEVRQCKSLSLPSIPFNYYCCITFKFGDLIRKHVCCSIEVQGLSMVDSLWRGIVNRNSSIRVLIRTDYWRKPYTTSKVKYQNQCSFSNSTSLGTCSWLKIRNKVIEIGIRVLKQIHLNMY